MASQAIDAEFLELADAQALGPLSDHPPITQSHFMPGPVLGRAEGKEHQPSSCPQAVQNSEDGNSYTHRTQTASWPQPFAGALPDSSPANPSTPQLPLILPF